MQSLHWTLRRGSGTVAILALSLWVIYRATGAMFVECTAKGPETYAGWVTYNRIMPFLLLLLAVGFVALYAAHTSHGEFGRSGRAFFRFSLVGFWTVIATSVGEFWVYPALSNGSSILAIAQFSWIIALLAFGWGMVLLALRHLMELGRGQEKAFLYISSLPGATVIGLCDLHWLSCT